MDLGHITFGARSKILNLDKSFIGSRHYMGLAYFWGADFKHTLRDISYAKRKKIHNDALEKGINFDKHNIDAWSLIAKVLDCDVNTLVDIKEIENEIY